MEILEQTRIQFHHKYLKKELPAQPIKRSSVFLENAKTVGILFDATLLEERSVALAFIERLKKEGKKVKLLGFFNEKLKSTDFAFTHFDKNQLDWIYRPKNEDAKSFANQSFDLMINLSKKTILPLDYIAALSKAKFRVGPFTENIFCYDLMIDHNEEKGLTAFLKEVLHYLKKMQSIREPALV